MRRETHNEHVETQSSCEFFAVTLIYLLAAVAGIVVYHSFSLDWWLNLLIADVAATVVIFAFSVPFDSASVYDPYWSIQPVVILVDFAAGKELTVVRCFLLTAVIFGGTRLTANWAYTFQGLAHQDWRYTLLKEQTGTFYPFVNFIGIHMVPTLIVCACILPAVYAFLHDGAWNEKTVIFSCLSIGAAMMQGIADYQMHCFQKHRTGIFIRDGLWRYSRPPIILAKF